MNVSASAVSFSYDCGESEPEVWVRDEKGVPAELTKGGVSRYGGPFWHLLLANGSSTGKELMPGDGLGFNLPLSKYFVLDRPGSYTVLASMSVNLRSELVAKPLMIEVRSPAPERGATPGQKPEETSRPRPAGEPSDTEWTEVAAKAGRPVDGCVLERLTRLSRREKPTW